jgi:2-oxoglutarate dehydrogenase E1 component
VLDDADVADPKAITRLVMCSGTVFYDLREARRAQNIGNVALVRLEQLYPFPEEELSAVFARYTNLTEVVWCQEEPMNQGAWYSSQHHMRRVINRHNRTLYLEYAGRDASASPAAGYMALHLEQLERLTQAALKGARE